ncbi:MAG: 2-hydroxyacid dehydrogenase [Candidatus Dormiibacterota bacterium]
MRRALEPLPEGVELVAEPGPGVELIVVGFEFGDRLASFVDALPDLKVVQSLSAGVDWLVPLIPPGVVVCKSVGVHDGPVAEWIVAAMLAMQRRLPEFLELQRHATWDRSVIEADSVDDLEAHTVVVVGHGSIGRALAARLAPFGVRTIGVAQHARADAQPVSALPSLLPQADVVVDLLPLTPETERFVDSAFLARMKHGALFVNAGRGRTVDTDALLAALQAGRIRAALDVTDPEPLPSDHALWRASNVLITPHVAGAVERWEERGYRFAGEQIRRHASGEPLEGVVAATTTR